MAVLGTRIRKFLGIAQKVRHSCVQNRHDLLAKIVEHIDGTSGAKRGCNTDRTLGQLF